MKQTLQPDISVIIPFCYRKGDRHCLTRLQNAVSCFAGKQGAEGKIEIVVYDTTPGSPMGRVNTVSERPGVRYFHRPESGVFRPGRTRNLAVEQAKGQYLFFFDADLLCSDGFVSSLLAEKSRLEEIGAEAFAMFPCLYLSQKTTGNILAGKAPSFSEYLRSFLRGELTQVDGIAVVSSCLLVNRQWFLDIGRFNCSFSGHGYEDFELIHRLAAYYPVGKLPEDYKRDVKSPFPANYQGFRRYLSFYSLPYLFTGNYLLHQWHSRPLARPYHKQRKVNEKTFSGLLAASRLPVVNGIKPFASEHELPDFQQWILSCMEIYGYNASDFPGLFRWREGVKRPTKLMAT